MLFANFAISDAADNIAPTPFIINYNYVHRKGLGVLPDGNVFVAVHNYLNIPSQSETFYGIVDPASAGFDGDPLIENATPLADAGNTGDGTMSEVIVALAAPTANWTVTCTDDSVAGSEVWSVANDAKAAAYYDATTGDPYTNDNADIYFTITAGGTDFAVGDSFTFSTENNAMVFPVTNISPGDTRAAPAVFVDPHGAGILLSLKSNDDGNNFFYYLLGYDGEVLAGPTQISDVDDSTEETEWPRVNDCSMFGGKVYVAWSQNVDDGTKADLGYAAMLGIDDYPVTKPMVDSVTPDVGTEGTATAITITGSGFDTNAETFIGDVALVDVTVDSATSISATVPDTAAVGVYDIMVVNPDTLFGVLEDGYEVEAEADDDDTEDDDDEDDDDEDDDDEDDDDDDATGGGDDDDDDDGCCGC